MTKEAFDAHMDSLRSSLSGATFEIEEALNNPRYDEEYKLAWDPRINEEFFVEFKKRVQAMTDFLYSKESPFR